MICYQIGKIFWMVTRQDNYQHEYDNYSDLMNHFTHRSKYHTVFHESVQL